ncbi:MAG TPA: hypothetical protein VJ991_12170 [Balneolales bacterium]|nr:hypothetical protein [Balneolales bacterium]
MKYINLVILFSLLSSGLVFGQNNNSINDKGSLYSYYGIGTLNDYRDSDAQGMGMSGIGLNVRSANLANPAMWGNVFYTSGSGGFFIRNIESSDNLNKNIKTNLEPSHFQLVIPVKRNKVGVSLGLFPISSSNYSYTKSNFISPINSATGDTVNYNVNNSGSGGIDYLELGIGWQINKNLAVGYAPSLVFGILKDDITTNFSSTAYQPIQLNRKISNIGFGNRAGIYFQKSRVFSDHDQLSVGLMASLPVHLSSTLSVQNYIASSGGTVSNPTKNLKNGNLRLPLRTGMGISYWINQKVLVGSEVLYQKWSDFQNIDGKHDSYLKDRIRLGVGTQFLPANKRSNSFFQNLAYRVGFSYDSGYLKLNDTSIQSWFITAGLGIPSKVGSSININAEYGFTGSKANNLIRERIFSLRISFNLTELMFLKHKIQ